MCPLLQDGKQAPVNDDKMQRDTVLTVDLTLVFPFKSHLSLGNM